MKSLRLKMKDDNPLEVSHFYLLIYDGYLLKVDDVNLQTKKLPSVWTKNLCTLLEIAIIFSGRKITTKCPFRESISKYIFNEVKILVSSVFIQG